MKRESVLAIVLTFLLGTMLFSTILQGKCQEEVHDLKVSLSTSNPSIIRGTYNHLPNGSSTILYANVTNNGSADESNVGLQLLINDNLVLSALTPTLAVNQTFWTAYYWKPLVDGDYNLTVCSPPVTGENNTADNNVTNWVRVCPDMPPTVSFEATWTPQYPPPGPIENQTVTFDASSSIDPDWGMILSYTWNFGDGSNTTTVQFSNITHTYTQWRNCTVTLTLLDTENMNNGTSRNMTIYARPIASFQPSGIWYVNHTTTFNATGSYDPDNNAPPTKGIALYSWDFGDNVSVSSPNSTMSHNYTVAGSYPVTLNVTDFNGLVSDTITKWVIINIGRPIASFSVQGLRCVGYNLTFDASSSSDPDNDIGPPTHGIASYYWNFGDYTNVTVNNPIVQHSYQAPGNYLVNLTVTDADEGMTNSGISLISISYEVFVELVDNITGSHDLVHNPGEYFKMNIAVSNVTDLFSYYVGLTWPGTGEYPIFDWVTADTGGFLGPVEDFDLQGCSAYQGYLNVTSVRVGTGGVNGSGTLAVVTFHVNSTMPGNCTVTIRYSLLKNSINGTTNCTTVNAHFYTSKPVASFDFLPSGPTVNTTVEFDASHSYCPDGGNIISYYWDFGDNQTGEGMTPTHSYDHSGTFDVNLTVTDGKSNETWSIVRSVEVTAGPEIDIVSSNLHECCFNNATGFYETAGILPINMTLASYESAMSVNFNITIRFNQTERETQLFTLAPGQSIYAWINATIHDVLKGDISKGTYIVSARAWCKNNSDEWFKPWRIVGMVQVYLAGNVNRDNGTDILDSIIIGLCFYSRPGDPNWNWRADLNCDGRVDILDNIIVSNNFNRKEP